jgi:hypothetical protein
VSEELLSSTEEQKGEDDSEEKATSTAENPSKKEPKDRMSIKKLSRKSFHLYV